MAESGDVPCLAGGEQGDGAVGEAIGEVERREMRGGGFVEDEVAMDFIGNENEIVGHTEFRELFDFRAGKDFSERILRVAQEEYLCGRGDGIFHGYPVKAPTARGEGVIDGNQLGFGIVVNTEKGRVNRGAGHYRFARLAKCAGG